MYFMKCINSRIAIFIFFLPSIFVLILLLYHSIATKQQQLPVDYIDACDFIIANSDTAN